MNQNIIFIYKNCWKGEESMLFGTSLLFRISYFFTAFAPALFILSIKQPLKLKINGVVYDKQQPLIHIIEKCLLPAIVILLAGISIYYLKKYLSERQQNNQYEVKKLALNFDRIQKKIKGGHVIQVQDGVKINTGFISFATSVVAPSIVLSLLENNEVYISLLIIVMFFLLLMLSNDTFPNIILPIFGVQLMVTKDDYNVFYFTKDSEFLTGTKKIHSIGNSGSLARTYIITDVEFTSDEVEVIDEK